jgi:hypothetical protein
MSYGVALRNGVPFTLGTIAALCTNATGSAWSPLALWPDGIATPGMWISPRDLTSQWADYTGTTPVSVPGTVADSSNPVGLALDIRAGATVLTDPGNHMLQSTSAARPLASAYDGQTLGPGDTYDSAGYPIFQLYDGVDDGQATAAFAAGTLIDGMDCLIAVRRDSAALPMIGGLYQADQTKYFGVIGITSGDDPGTYGGCGTPTIFVDGVSVANTRGALFDVMTVGDFHILEYRGLDLSAWVDANFGKYGVPYNVNGARGDILLYPSTASTEDKDAARQWLADYYGVTLP